MAGDSTRTASALRRRNDEQGSSRLGWAGVTGRGTCPGCKREYALTKAGKIRAHRCTDGVSGPNPHRAPLSTENEERTCQSSDGPTVTSDVDQFLSAETRPEPKRPQWGRYRLPHPVTGKEQSWQRVTTFARMASDGFGLEQWKLRMALKGASLRPDLVALAASLDAKKDAKRLNALVEQAREAAGGSAAANLGTAIHALTETVDLAKDKRAALSDVPVAQRSDVAAYLDCLDAHGIVVVPEMVERITCVPAYEVAGTLDRGLEITRSGRITLRSGRTVTLRSGEHVIGDVKTGKDLSHGEGEIAVQLHSYAQGVNEAGVWDHGSQRWADVPKVRGDVAFVMHVPAGTGTCTLYVIDLDMGREAAKLCVAVRAGRKVKGFLTAYEPESFKLDLSKIGTEEQGPSPYMDLLERFASIRTNAQGSALYHEACETFGTDSDEVKRLVEIGKAALS